MQIKIKYKKKRLNSNLILGLIWSFLAAAQWILLPESNIMNYLWTILSLLYLGLFFYEYRNQYVTIENEMICKSYRFSKKVRLVNITSINKVAQDYILKTKIKELKIDTSIIEKKSLLKLNQSLQQLNLPTNKTPF